MNATLPCRAAQSSAAGTGKCSSCLLARDLVGGRVLAWVFLAAAGLWRGVTHPDRCSDAWAVSRMER